MLRFLLKHSVIRKGFAMKKVLPSFRFSPVQFFSTNSIVNDKVSAKISDENKLIELSFKSESSNSVQTLEFPFVWLRDNCQCQKCYHSSSYSRIINWESFDVNVKPKSIQYDDQKNVLKIVWNDESNHTSEYKYEWLNERNFCEENQQRYLNTFYRPPKILLRKDDFKKNLEYFDYKKVIENDEDLYKWLHSMITKGVAIVINVPESENEVRNLANRVSFIRRTHYGEEFIVKAKEGTSNVAYLPQNLQMHTDLPYYDYAPGTNLLHCLVQTKSVGAENLLTDGFYIAQKMQEACPEDFEILSKLLVNWSDIGQEDNIPFHSIYRAPMICVDYAGKITRINHSVPQRDSFFSASVNSVQLWYKALARFIDLMYKEAVEMKMKEGTILCFDNSRLIHGRRKYEDSGDNRRHIIGAYLDWDEIFSRYRVLQKRFGN